ncbi:MAG TPA: hypothetical protein VMJ52_00145 [Xanthobacteraceae bacterium]|nr:hypothetical protein [Xanthobacteraceae bacterium]
MSEKPENKLNTTIDNSGAVTAKKSKSSAIEGELSEHELSKVSAGSNNVGTFKLVAVKTVSWAHDDES